LSKPSDIELIATKLFVSDDNILKGTDECTWKVLSMDQSIHSLSYKRVDHFWREVFSQTTSNYTKRYPIVTDVLKIALNLPHGNADVERWLPLMVRATKDVVKFYDPELMRPAKAPYN